MTFMRANNPNLYKKGVTIIKKKPKKKPKKKDKR